MLALRTPLILASRSPRRRFLLDRLGLAFTVHPSDTDEVVDPDVPPAETVEKLARQKAEAVAPDYPDALTLGADTVVVLGGAILGKPDDEAQAAEMLGLLSGQTHTVFSGIALVHPASGRTVSAYEATDVTFGDLDNAEIQAYVRSGSPLDKAGAYGIQDDAGALLVERVEGDYYNVVGLPLRRLYRTLRTHFADLLAPLDTL